jgi:hypothetical protein
MPRLTDALVPPGDLREWISLLEREGELVRVSAEVDPHLEITEIVDRVVKSGGPALLFENPKSQHALLINQFGTERRMCLAFGADSLDDVGRRLGDVLEMQPPQGLAEKVRGLKKLKSIADSQPKSVRSGPVQEVVLTGNEVDLGRLPVQTCWPGDAAPFITLPAVITTDPRTGGRNVGMYRLQVLDQRTTAMHWQIHKDGRADYLLADGKLEVAVALGLDPVTAYAASAPLPKHVDELMMAGFLRGESVELVVAGQAFHWFNRDQAKYVPFKTKEEVLNHLEIMIGKDSLEVWATDLDDMSTFRKVAHIDGLGLTFTRGYVNLQHSQYNAEKGGLDEATTRQTVAAVASTPQGAEFLSKVMRDAHGLAIVTVLKAGFVFSGRGGEGVVVARLPNGKWSGPSFVGFGGVYQPELIRKYIGLGMRMILCGNDVGLLFSAAQERAGFVRRCRS